MACNSLFESALRVGAADCFVARLANMHGLFDAARFAHSARPDAPFPSELTVTGHSVAQPVPGVFIRAGLAARSIVNSKCRSEKRCGSVVSYVRSKNVVSPSLRTVITVLARVP